MERKMKNIRGYLTKEWIFIPILVIWASLIFIKYNQYHPFLYQKIKPLFEPAILTFYAIIFLLISLGIGYRIFRLFKLPTSLLETFLFSTGIGFGILMYLTFFIGVLGGLYHSVIYISLSLLGLLASKELIRLFSPLLKEKRQKNRPKDSISFFERGLKIILIFLLLLCFFSALTPAIGWDSAVAHLNLPKIYLNAHKIGFVANSFSSNLPLNMQMLYLLALVVKGPILAKLIHFTFGILILLMIKSFSQRYFSNQIGLLAMVIFLTNPVVIFEATIAYIDLGVSFYSLLALYGFFCWLDSNNKKWLYLMAIFSGISLGMKYTAGFGIIILGAGMLIKLIGKDHLNIYGIFKNICLFFIISALFLVPWAIKSYLLTGNPVYPMLSGIFGGVDKEFIQDYDKFVYESCLGRGFMNYLLLPWNLTILATYGHKYFDNFINPFGLIFIPFLVFLKKIDNKIIYLLGYCLSFIFLWSFFAQRMRFLLPVIPLISLISAYTIHTLLSQGKLFKKIYQSIQVAILALLSFISLPHIVGIGNDFGVANNLLVVSGMESQESFLLRTFETYDTFKYINENLPAEAKILFLWENRGFYCSREYIADSMFESSYILRIVRASKNSAGLLKKLKEMKITHILLNKNLWSIFYQDKKEGIELKIIEEFLGRYTELVYTKNNVDLFKIKE